MFVSGRVFQRTPNLLIQNTQDFRVQVSWESRERVVLQGVPWWKSGPHEKQMLKRAEKKVYLWVKNITHLPHDCVFVGGRIPWCDVRKTQVFVDLLTLSSILHLKKNMSTFAKLPIPMDGGQGNLNIPSSEGVPRKFWQIQRTKITFLKHVQGIFFQDSHKITAAFSQGNLRWSIISPKKKAMKFAV